MGEGLVRCLALLACSVLFASYAAFAPVQQTARASATSTQKAANVSTGGSASQQNDSAAVVSANNGNQIDQSTTQQQDAGSAPPPDPAPGQTQTSSQSAPVTQNGVA